MPFKPKIHKCEIEDDGESLEFFVKEPSGREILAAAEDSKKNPDRTSMDNARSLFANYIVHEDGTKLEKPEVEEYLDMRLSAMNKVSAIVQDRIGLKKLEERLKNA